MSRTWSAVVAAVALLMMAVGAHAQNVNAVRKTAMATMLVTGEIEIKPDGHVQSYTLDQQDKLSPAIRGLLAKAIPLWVFEPMVQPDGSSLRSKMSVRLVAEPVGDAYEMRVRSASFGGDPDSQPGATTVWPSKTEPPVYPQLAAQVGAGGTVYLLLEIGRDGKVIHVDVEQTNLTVVASERDMATLREQFERAALRVAKDWTFQIPTIGEEASRSSWVGRAPVEYAMSDRQDEPPYGTWKQYVPGPRKPIPWYEAKKAAGQDQGLEAGLEGQVSQLGYGPKLLTRLDGS